MLSQILNELAQVELWLTDMMSGHQECDPESCGGAALYGDLKVLLADTEDEVTTAVVFGLVTLLSKTKNPARVGVLIVDKVRQICAVMAADRIRQRRVIRMRDTGVTMDISARSYNTPN